MGTTLEAMPMARPEMVRPTTSCASDVEAACSLEGRGGSEEEGDGTMSFRADRRPGQEKEEGRSGRTHIEPTIQMTPEICMATLREYLSAMKEDARAPTREPAGMEAVMPPCR